MVLPQFLQDLSSPWIHLNPSPIIFPGDKIVEQWLCLIIIRLQGPYLGLDISASTSLHLYEKHFLSQVMTQQYNYYVVTFIHNF